jgi:hypothetical protein
MDELLAEIQSTFSVTLHDARRVDTISPPSRLAVYRESIPDLTEVFAIVGRTEEGDVREFVFAKNSIVSLSCQVTFEDLTPSDCIEYMFSEEPDRWFLAQVSMVALEEFKQKKFKLWEHQLKEPGCEAAFRRILHQGPIRNVYDKFIFPSPESTAGLFKVTDEHSGKSVDIPHQVDRLRKWNAETESYDEIDASLVGAPKNEKEADTYWARMLDGLRELRGKDYIDSLLA